jgi:hypothetical protein
MKKSKTVKALTLVCFGILLTSFIVFKSGTFDKYLNTDSKVLPRENKQISNLENIPKDTPTIKAVDTVKVNPTMFSTSKSLILIDQKIKFPIQDSLKVKPKQ